MISQLVIQLNENSNNENEASIDGNMLEQMDPDNDGFNISYEEAERLNKNMNILHFIRKYILANNAKLFNSGVNSLVDQSKGFNLSSNWNCEIYDKLLLKAVDENGLSSLNSIISNGLTYIINQILNKYPYP